MSRVAVTLAGVCAVVNITHAAETLPITPGLWEIISTSTNPLMDTRTYTEQE